MLSTRYMMAGTLIRLLLHELLGHYCVLCNEDYKGQVQEVHDQQPTEL